MHWNWLFRERMTDFGKVIYFQLARMFFMLRMMKRNKRGRMTYLPLVFFPSMPAKQLLYIRSTFVPDWFLWSHYSHISAVYLFIYLFYLKSYIKVVTFLQQIFSIQAHFTLWDKLLERSRKMVSIFFFPWRNFHQN